MKLKQITFWAAGTFGLLMATGTILFKPWVKGEGITDWPWILGSAIAMYFIAFVSGLLLLPHLSRVAHWTTRGLLFIASAIVLAAINVFLMGNDSYIPCLMGMVAASLVERVSEESPQ